jgi:Fe-S-cluster containining protein
LCKIYDDRPLFCRIENLGSTSFMPLYSMYLSFRYFTFFLSGASTRERARAHTHTHTDMRTYFFILECIRTFTQTGPMYDVPEDGSVDLLVRLY